jgi:hypothetical protein
MKSQVFVSVAFHYAYSNLAVKVNYLSPPIQMLLHPHKSHSKRDIELVSFLSAAKAASISFQAIVNVVFLLRWHNTD